MKLDDETICELEAQLADTQLTTVAEIKAICRALKEAQELHAVHLVAHAKWDSPRGSSYHPVEDTYTAYKRKRDAAIALLVSAIERTAVGSRGI